MGNMGRGKTDMPSIARGGAYCLFKFGQFFFVQLP
jgi:hypothetical protein